MQPRNILSVLTPSPYAPPGCSVTRDSCNPRGKILQLWTRHSPRCDAIACTYRRTQAHIYKRTTHAHTHTYIHTHNAHTHCTVSYQRIEFEQFYEYCLMMKMFNPPDTEDQQTSDESKVIKCDETETNILFAHESSNGACPGMRPTYVAVVSCCRRAEHPQRPHEYPPRSRMGATTKMRKCISVSPPRGVLPKLSLTPWVFVHPS